MSTTITDDNGLVLTEFQLRNDVRTIMVERTSDAMYKLQLRTDDDTFSITVDTNLDHDPVFDLLNTVFDVATICEYGPHGWFDAAHYQQPIIYNDANECFKDLVRSHHITVDDAAEITFTGDRINDDKYERSLAFPNIDGVIEKYIYHSHGSVVYHTLKGTFDIKRIETECEADIRAHTEKKFTASEYLIVWRLQQDLRHVGVSDSMDVEDVRAYPGNPENPENPGNPGNPESPANTP